MDDVILHMGPAMAVFEALKSEKISERVKGAEHGALGARNIQVWTSKIGGELHYAVSNGGCTLTIKPDANLREAVEDFIATLDEYPEQLVPLNRNSAVVRQMREALWNDGEKS